MLSNECNFHPDHNPLWKDWTFLMDIRTVQSNGCTFLGFWRFFSLPNEGIPLPLRSDVQGVERLGVVSKAGFVHCDLIVKLEFQDFDFSDEFGRWLGIDFSLPIAGPSKISWPRTQMPPPTT